MRSWIWLRSLAVLLALFAAGHTLGTAAPQVRRGARESIVFAAMQGFRFPVMGFERSYWDFYRGFALTISVLLVVMAAIAWQLAALAKRDPRAALPMTVSLLAGCVGLLTLGAAFFFGGPIVMSGVAVLLAAASAAALAREGRRGA